MGGKMSSFLGYTKSESPVGSQYPGCSEKLLRMQIHMYVLGAVRAGENTKRYL